MLRVILAHVRVTVVGIVCKLELALDAFLPFHFVAGQVVLHHQLGRVVPHPENERWNAYSFNLGSC